MKHRESQMPLHTSFLLRVLTGKPLLCSFPLIGRCFMFLCSFTLLILSIILQKCVLIKTQKVPTKTYFGKAKKYHTMDVSYTAYMLTTMGYENVKISVLYSLTKILQDYILAIAKDSKYFHPNELSRPDYDYLVRILTKNGIMMPQLMEYCILINLKKYNNDDFYVTKNRHSETTSVRPNEEVKDDQIMVIKGYNDISSVQPVVSSMLEKEELWDAKTLI